MNLSYWEKTSWLDQLDFAVIGSGIVGLFCGLRLRQRYPNAKIAILERGRLPQGASTKNAGFACFGSLSEILDDLQTHSETAILELVAQRWEGLHKLRETLGDASLDFGAHGGYELFTQTDTHLHTECVHQMERINQMLLPIFKSPVYREVPNSFGFQKIVPSIIFNAFEGQIDTGKMMWHLLKKAIAEDIRIINNTSVSSYEELGSEVVLETTLGKLTSRHICVTTNGFAKQFGIEDLEPARAQVLITHPIPNLKIKGTFHLDKGYYYFRNIDNRILLGGGRNLDFNAEQTTSLEQTPLIQNALEDLLGEVILPTTNFEIDHRWSGIMGVGSQKKPILKSLTPRVHLGVRLGGMGVAIGSSVGTQLADHITL